MAYENEFPKELLRKRKLKATSTRINVLQLIRAYKTAMPYSLIQQSLIETDRVTLYRTLNVLLKKGLIHKAYATNEGTYYALCGENCTAKAHSHNHIHFKCTSCKTVTCQQLNQDIVITLPTCRIDKININVTGLCQNCNL